MAQLQQTRLQLTIILSSIVALLFFIIGESFFSFKFISDKSHIEKQIKEIQEIIKTQDNEIITFIHTNTEGKADTNSDAEISKILDFTKQLFKNPEINFEDIGEKKDVDDIIIKGKSEFQFFDHTILFYNPKGKKVLYSNIGENNQIDINKYIYAQEGLSYNSDLAQYKFTIQEYVGIAFIKRNYTSHEFITDSGILIIFILVFSLVFFALGTFFVKKIFEPVEENIREMDDFIDNAGHELKTPLAAIQSSSSLMKELKDFEPELIQEIIDETNKSNEIISALRSLSKISKHSTSETFTVKNIILDIYSSQKSQAEKSNITLSFSDKNDLEITANKNYFYIALSNIISNAIKYNKQSGSVNIKIGDGYINISDSGIGIPKQDTNKIFQRFHRLKNHSNIEGFGLGLSMVEKICKIYNWKISIESIESVGTKVKIMF